MSSLLEGIERYLSLRKVLGFSLRSDHSHLRNFGRYMDELKEDRITTRLALAWATQPVAAAQSSKADRLAAVRLFAAWWRATDPRTEVPHPSLLPYRISRQRPHIFCGDEISRLLASTKELRSARKLRGATYSTVFALLAVTGLRISEAVALDSADIDIRQGTIFVRRSKHGKSRLVPIHTSTADALARYARRRDRVLPVRDTTAFFVSDERHSRITHWSARYNFARASQHAGLRPAALGYRHGIGPRLHDLRHTFAVRTLIDWYAKGRDVDRELPKLSAFLGHVHVADTYWYLEAVPELMSLALKRASAKTGRHG